MRKLLLLMLIAVLSVGQLLAQTKTITGRVTDEKGNSVSNASITVKGFKSGVTSEADGSFSIEIASSARVLVISAVGYASQQISIVDQSSIVVTLKLDVKAEDEVIIIGYGKQKKKSQTGSATIIDAKKFGQAPVASFDNLLQGASPGVQVSAVNGKPGSVAFVKIRGTGSANAGQGALVVIDGVPSVPQTSTTGIPTDNLNMINPSDIESVTILKDAAAASIYGSRASNGVILVTTKKGKVGRPQLTYRFQYGQISKTPDFNFKMMDAGQKLQYEYDLGYENPYITDEIANRGLPAGSDLFSISPADRQSIWNKLIKGQNNWQDLVLRNGQLSSHELSLSGGVDKFKYYLSLNLYDEQGIGVGSKFKRTTGRINVEYQAKEWFKIGTNTAIGYTKENLLRDRINVQSPFVAMYLYNAYENPKNSDGTWNLTTQGLNILEEIENIPENNQKVGGLNTIYGEFSFLKHLTIRSEVGLNFVNIKHDTYTKAISDLARLYLRNGGSKTDDGSWDFTTSWVNTATWSQILNEKHNLEFLLGTEYNENKFSSYRLISRGFPTPDVNQQSNGATPDVTRGTASEWALFSGFGRFLYNYNQTYYAEASIRRDGSSRFGIKNRYGNFWSFGAGWDISKEAFFKVKEINFLKLRTSVGTSGNFNVENYQSLGLFGYTRYNAQPAGREVQLENPNLTWENNFNYDMAVVFEAFNYRLTGSIEYYHRKTFDLLFNVPKSFTTGFQNRLENVGEIANKGFEFTLGYDIIRNKNFQWNILGSLTLNSNKVTKLYGDVDQIAADPVNSATFIKVGEPLNVFFMNRWAGVNTATGAPQYLDKNGNVTSIFSADDGVILTGKSPDPKYFGSINNTVRYKGFSLSADIYFSGGNFIYNSAYQGLIYTGSNYDQNLAASNLNYWKKPGDKAENPALDSTRGFITDRFLEKGDFIRLRSLALSYNIPTEALSKIKLQGITIYIQAQNLLTITKFKGEPEVGISSGEDTYIRNGEYTNFSYPQTRRVVFGVNVNF